MDINKRRPTVPPRMTPLAPEAGSSAGTSTSQTAAAPGVVVGQPVSQQVYVPSYRVSLFGEALLHAAFLDSTYAESSFMHRLLIPTVACLPSALYKGCRQSSAA